MKRRFPLPYVQAFVDKKTDHIYYYFRRPGFPHVRLPGLPLSPEFMAAYQQAMASAPVPVGVKRSAPGSVSAAIAAYYQSTLTFGSLSPGTQRMYRQILERFRNEHGQGPIARMPPGFISAVLNKLDPHAARNWFKVIRALCQFCVADGLIKADPTLGMKLPKVPKSDGHHTWIEAEIEQYEAAHPIGTKARLALALGIYTVQRRVDVVQMGRQHVSKGEVIKVGDVVIDKWLRAMPQQKTRSKYDIPIFPELRAIIDATPSNNLTFLVADSGQPYRLNNFSERFRDWCDEAGLPKRCTFHGLRKYGCVYFAERGCGAPEIAAWSGHMTLREVEKYIREANRKTMARNAMIKVLTAQAEEREQKDKTGA
jgi:integrase